MIEYGEVKCLCGFLSCAAPFVLTAWISHPPIAKTLAHRLSALAYTGFVICGQGKDPPGVNQSTDKKKGLIWYFAISCDDRLHCQAITGVLGMRDPTYELKVIMLLAPVQKRVSFS